MTRKGWVVVLTIAAASSAAVFGYAATRTRTRVRYVSAPAERGLLTARVSATGTLSALVTVQVGSQISGRIQELTADFNTRVSKGQVLARIDSQLLQAALAQARASFQAAAGQLTRAQAKAKNEAHRLERSRTLSAGKLIADADLEQAEADSETARAEAIAARGNLEQARAAMREAEATLTYATILSPIDGIVISRNVDVGQTVAASLQAPTLFTIAGDLTKMQVDTSVAEADVGKLRPAMPALFTVDAYPSTVFRGTVREVRNAPQMIQGVVTYDAVVDVGNLDLRLKPGMTAHVSFTYAERRDAVSVPNAAFRFRPNAELDKPMQRARRKRGPATEDSGAAAEQRTVWVLTGDAPVPVSVRVGISDGSSTEIIGDSLRSGQAVLVDAFEPGETSGSSERTSAAPRLF